MTTAELKALKISGQTVFAKMQKWGWVDAVGKPLSWERFVNRKGREDLGRVGTSFISVSLPAAKTSAEHAENQQLASAGKEWRILRTNTPAPSRSHEG